MSTEIRVCLQYMGTAYTFVTFVERPENDLVVAFRARGVVWPYRDSSPWRRGKRVSVSRFSIHPSNKSQSLTTIKFTQICEGQIYTSVLYTTAIKKTNSFCPFVFIASSKTNVKRDIAKSSARRIILDMVDDRCTFLYSLAVGQRETPFLWSPLEYINSKQIKFNKFSIVILYAFVTISSSDYGSALTVNTKDIMRPFDGLSVLDCCHYFNTFIKELKGRLILMYKTANSPQSTLDIVERAIFVKHGTSAQQGYQEWRLSLMGQGLLDPQTIETRTRPIPQ